MSNNKMLTAYRTLLNHAKDSVILAEQKTWEVLGKAVTQAEQADHALAELTAKEFAQVQEDVRADLMQTAEYFADVEKGIEEFITLDLALIEQILIDKALTLADPTDITVLRMRLAAAIDENHPAFGHQTKR